MNDEKLDITVIVLTYNEKLHIERCLTSIKTFAKYIIVVDSFSTDGTQKLAQDLGAVVVENKFINYAKQFNWALNNLQIKTKWVMRLDADEYLTTELITDLKMKFNSIPDSVTGLVFNLKHIFIGRPMSHGAYPVKLLRTFRYGYAQCEDRWMDEHIELTEGEIMHFDFDFVDHNLNNLSWWVQKHNSYAVREAIDLLNLEIPLINSANQNGELSEQAKLKRQKKLKYARLPLFWRAFFYFLYRYFIKLGFLDGKEGFLWNFLQGWWYRTLVDAKIFEFKKHCGNDPQKIKKYLFDNHNISL